VAVKPDGRCPIHRTGRGDKEDLGSKRKDTQYAL
jgi:hypothetical protein